MTKGFLEYDFGDEEFDLVLGNPPFSGEGKYNRGRLALAFYEKAKDLSSIVGFIIPMNSYTNKYSNEFKVIQTFAPNEFEGATQAIVSGVYNKTDKTAYPDFRSYIQPTDNYIGRATGGTKIAYRYEVSDKLATKSLGGYLVSFAGESDTFGKKYNYFDKDSKVTVGDLVKLGHTRITWIECSNEEADTIYELASSVANYSGSMTYDTGWLRAFNILSLSEE